MTLVKQEESENESINYNKHQHKNAFVVKVQIDKMNEKLKIMRCKIKCC